MDKIIENIEKGIANGKAKAEANSGLDDLVSGTYVDKNGDDVIAGDILYYDEGADYAKGIHEVVERDGKLFGKTHFFNGLNNEWTEPPVEDLVGLEHYTSFSKGTVLNDAEKIGTTKDNPEMLTLKWAVENKPLAH